jgi:hypothetical protein
LSIPIQNFEMQKFSFVNNGEDLSGNKYNKLTVVKYHHSKKSITYWTCLCDCGNYTVVPRSNLLNGHTKSCGCGKSRFKYDEFGESMFRKVWYSYLANAKSRNIPFELTMEQVRTLTKESCFYCRCEPMSVSHRENTNGDYIYNGIDRLDNEFGYTIDNVVPCCKNCNLAKNDMSYPDFIAWVSRISDNFMCRAIMSEHAKQ